MRKNGVKATVFGLAALGLSGCATMGGGSAQVRAPMTASAAVPAAEGQVQAKSEGANTKLNVKVEHMAPVTRVQPGARAYVVWARSLTGDSSPTNLGVLGINEKREGKLSTITPMKQFQLFVTAEPTGQSTAPSGDPLLTANVVLD